MGLRNQSRKIRSCPVANGYLKDRLHDKYVVTKVDGSPTDPDAEYFVLRIDRDPFARLATRKYAALIRSVNPDLADDLESWLERTRDSQGAIDEVVLCEEGETDVDLQLAQMGRKCEHARQFFMDSGYGPEKALSWPELTLKYGLGANWEWGKTLVDMFDDAMAYLEH